jgi:tRNA nucleotidyltransferase/poly(A) polymerase
MTVQRQPWAMPTEGAAWVAALRVLRALVAAGHQAVFVGGCVRDGLLGLPVKDVDVATSAAPATVESVAAAAGWRCIAVGRAFGVIIVVPGEGPHIEVASFRSDLPYVDGRRPQGIAPADEAGDMQRRDFTINALVADPVAGELRDHVGGLADLAARRLRMVGDPVARLAEDRLRIWRACRFAARCGLELEPATAAALRTTTPSGLSRERIWDEWRKGLSGPWRSSFVRLAQELVGVQHAFPPLAELTAADWAPLARLGATAPATTALATLWAARSDWDWATWLRQEPISREERDTLLGLLRGFAALPQLAEASLAQRRRLAHEPLTPALAELAMARLGAEHPVVHDLRALLANEAGRQAPVPLLDGADLRALGIPAGPAMGRLLAELADAQWEDRIADRAAAILFINSRQAR